MSRRALRDEFERILRNRTYDRHAHDEETFEELLDELADAAADWRYLTVATKEEA